MKALVKLIVTGIGRSEEYFSRCLARIEEIAFFETRMGYASASLT